MIVLQAVAIAVALVVLVTMAFGPEIQDWHERTPMADDRPEAAITPRWSQARSSGGQF